MSNEVRDLRVGIHMSLEENRQLFHKLATDDDFRAQVASNPVVALAPFGITIDQKDIPGSIELPSKEEFEHVCNQLDKEGTPEYFAIWGMFILSKS